VIALDANGADVAASAIARGGRRADPPVLVFGPSAEIGEASDVVDAPSFISNDEEPARAVRQKPEASIVRACKAVADGSASGLVSAGPTGAALAAASFHLRRLRGVHRPAIGALIPVPGNPTLLVDAGANAEVRPEQLVQFAHMGSAFMEAVHSVARPRIGLVSVGAEASKGTSLVVDTHERLSGSQLNFVGNIEGGDITAGGCDVVVCDGFTGNVALKLMEGTAKTVATSLREAIQASPLSMLGGLLIRGQLLKLKQSLDPNNIGGAILLGVRGVCVIAHGASTETGIANACNLAGRACDEQMIERMTEVLEAGGVLRSAGAASVRADGDE
jgi:glycerol-3-phosphate acyltransferase PlsX